ncbi:MAG TPA: cytochrome c biogenesis protein CcdA [bacterium]|nr:cytochrome c biogenesis protein CcdA [bacterium]
MHLSLAIAFFAGVLGFFSPCVVPLIPGYLSFVSGVSLLELDAAARRRQMGRVVGATLLFVLGFSLVFTGLGASASLLGGFILGNRELLGRIGGAVVIVFGLVMLGVLRVPGFYRERRIAFARRPAGLAGIVLVGMAFGFAWTPCVGPVLGAILTLAATTARAADGAVLLFAYSLGLALPFLATAALLTSAFGALRAIGRYAHAIEVTGGAFLVVMGAALLFDWIYRLNAWILTVFPVRPAL